MPSERISGRPGSKNGASPCESVAILPFVDVDADDVVADGRHCGGVHGAQVSASDDRQLHVTLRDSSMRWMPAAVGGGVLEAFLPGACFEKVLGGRGGKPEGRHPGLTGVSYPGSRRKVR